MATSILERFTTATPTTSKLQIERGIPVPADTRGPVPIYPFREMEVGDSFFVATTRIQHSVRRGASATGKRLGKRFTCRKVEGGLRIWRVE